MTAKKELSAAIVTIKDAPKMTKRGRKQVSAWLRRQARFLESHGDRMTNRFVAKYIYT